MAIHRSITFIVKHISLSFFFAVSGKTPYELIIARAVYVSMFLISIPCRVY